jgi:hypothetical protein
LDSLFRDNFAEPISGWDNFVVYASNLIVSTSVSQI